MSPQVVLVVGLVGAVTVVIVSLVIAWFCKELA